MWIVQVIIALCSELGCYRGVGGEPASGGDGGDRGDLSSVSAVPEHRCKLLAAASSWRLPWRWIQLNITRVAVM